MTVVKLGRGVVELIVLNVLRDYGPMRVKSIAKLEDIKEGSVWRCVDRLHKAGQLHIVRWHSLYLSADGRAVGGRLAPVYALGAGTDVPKPDLKQSKKMSDARYYQRWRSLGGRGLRTPDKGIKQLRQLKQNEMP